MSLISSSGLWIVRSFGSFKKCPLPTSMIGMGRVFINGSGIGSDSSMIAANDRNRIHTWTNGSSIDSNNINSDFHNYRGHVRSISNESSNRSTMDDEYGEMNSDGESYTYEGPFELESGDVLPEATIRYRSYGKLNEAKDNVIVICHALTGNASLHMWWGGLLGPNKAFDTSKYFVICTNILGSCYGSTNPTSINPLTKTAYGMDFPDVSVQDTVRLQLHLLQTHLGINSVKSVIGGSFGGMQAMEYAVQAGRDGYLRSVVPIACGAAHTAWQIALSEVQRQAIYKDPKWNNGNVDPNDPPMNGLSVARQIGMISYRTPLGYEKKFGREVKKGSKLFGSKANWQVKSYLEYQGDKFLSRFDPVTYVKLTEQMDSHDIGRNRGGKEQALANVNIPALVLGIDSDVLYPLKEQEEITNLFKKGELRVITSDGGHDGFLLEQDQVANHITTFLSKLA